MVGDPTGDMNRKYKCLNPGPVTRDRTLIIEAAVCCPSGHAQRPVVWQGSTPTNVQAAS